MNFFDPTNPLGWQVKALIIVTALTLFGGVCYVKGREAGLEKYYDLKSQVAAAQKQAEDDAVRQRAAQERIDRDTADGWAAAVAYWRGRPQLVRVLPAGSCVPQAGAVPTAAGKPDAPTAEPRPSAIYLTADQCEFRVNNALLDAAQVMHLQNWIQQQHQASQ